MKKIATLVRSLTGWTGDARLYRLSEPIKSYKDAAFDYVVVSATVAMFSGPETYIFGCDADGENVEFGELDGSYRGGLSHEQALTAAGYQIAKEEVTS